MLDDAGEPVGDDRVRRLGEGPDGRVSTAVAGDDVVGRARAIPPTDTTTGSATSNCRVTSVCSARTISRGDRHRVRREVRHRPVPAAAVHPDDQLVGGRHQRARSRGDQRRRAAGRQHVQAVRRDDASPAASSTPSSIIASRRRALLAGLEHQNDVPGELVPRSASSRAAPTSPATCRSWPHACMRPVCSEENGSRTPRDGRAPCRRAAAPPGPGRPRAARRSPS